MSRTKLHRLFELSWKLLTKIIMRMREKEREVYVNSKCKLITMHAHVNAQVLAQLIRKKFTHCVRLLATIRLSTFFHE